MTSFAESITVDDLERDPYPVYARLRAESPVAWVPAVGLWLVTRAADVEFVTTRPDLFSAHVDGSPLDRSFGGPTILTVDGERHLDLRRSLDATYKPRVVASYIDELVTPIAEAALAAVLESPGNRAELMASYFEPISVLSLGAVLGLGHVPAETLQDWFHGLAMGAINFEGDPGRQRISDATAARIDAELRPLMESLQGSPDGSTIASMLTVGRMRTIEEVMPSLKVIILGGMQEPGHAAGSCLAGLLADAEQLRAERLTLMGRLDTAADDYADGVLDGRGYARIRERIQTQLAELDRAEADAERLRVFDGIPLGTPEVAAVVEQLATDQPDRYRAIIDLLMTVTIATTGKRGNVFDPERVKVEWR